MIQYQQLVQRIFDEGHSGPDRTGTGTLSVFGHQMRFNLDDGFPLLTVKRVFPKGMVDELLWFLRGQTNVNDLPERVQHWWAPWAATGGALGPIYGEQYRRSKWHFWTEPKLFDPPEVEEHEDFFCRVGDLGEFRRKPHHGVSEKEQILKTTWRDMVKRCYDRNAHSYKSYGAKGVHIDPEWLRFENFYRDAQNLPGWNLKRTYPDDYTLDKDIRSASNRYGPETCLWASRREQSLNTSTGTPFWATSPQGEELLFPSLGDAASGHGLSVSAMHRCLNGALHTHHGWSGFRYVYPHASGKVLRFREVDQLRQVIAEIKHNPSSRRLMINLWHTPAMEHALLPCCHGSVIQFYVRAGRVSCQVYQRSADVFLGVPVNIASYALLVHMVAKATDLSPGELVWVGGDCHLYLNHTAQANEVLGRKPLSLPNLLLTYEATRPLEEVKPEEISIIGYAPHPAIPAPVAI